MTLSESINFVPFYNKIKSQSMPVALAYKFARIYKEAKADEDFYHEHLREILYKYGELDADGNLIPLEDGQGIKVKPETQQECLKAIDELQNAISDLRVEHISLEELQGIEVTPADIESIMSFIGE